MKRGRSAALRGWLFPVVFWVCRWTSAADIPVRATQTETNRLDFGVFWPPRALAVAPLSNAKPLLNGCLVVNLETFPDRSRVARLRIVLSRPSDEEGRVSWNSRLAFPEYDWMRSVRVWDSDSRWLWPNLAYLLRLHGVERVERYGGVDPGKGVDNDFAGVLIREYDESGRDEAEATKREPLVAAEWFSLGNSAFTDKETVVHTVQSDVFTLHLGRADAQGQGRAAIWLIYADFMGAKVPVAWPKALEFAGGILAYFEVQWDLKAQPGQEVVLRQLVPRQGTGFDWQRWSSLARALQDPAVTAKLSDLPEGTRSR